MELKNDKLKNTKKHTIEELIQKQSLPLPIKIEMTKRRIRNWVDFYGEDGVYVSFSGGKDSTVLLDLVRNKCGFQDIPAVFVDTGLEYPEIRDFVKTFENVVWLRPKKNFKKIIEEFGYPFITKEVSGAVKETNCFLNILKKQGIEITNKLEFLEEAYKKNIDFGYKNKMPVRALQLIGKVPHKEKGIKTGELSKMFDKSKWGFLLDMPYGNLSNQCCQEMKKTPIKKYAKRTGRNPITGQMASESLARQSQWLKKGCNSFDSKNPMSNPLSFWTEQDILEYIRTYNIKICSVYGDIVEDVTGTDEVEGQMTISDIRGYKDIHSFDAKRLPLKTTGCTRTGCMFCGYGCHLEKPGEGRFELMKKTHPKQYDYIMKSWDEGGLGYKKIIDWINENGNLKIRY